MVTSAPCSHRAAQMSWAELLEPRTTHFLPAVVVGAADAGWNGAASPWNVSAPGICGTFGMPDMPVARTSCLGRSTTVFPSRSTVTVQSCVSSS